MENIINLEGEVLEKIIKKIIKIEKDNLKTKDLTDQKIVNKLKEIIEETVEVE